MTTRYRARCDKHRWAGPLQEDVVDAENDYEAHYDEKHRRGSKK